MASSKVHTLGKIRSCILILKQDTFKKTKHKVIALFGSLMKIKLFWESFTVNIGYVMQVISAYILPTVPTPFNIMH